MLKGGETDDCRTTRRLNVTLGQPLINAPATGSS